MSRFEHQFEWDPAKATSNLAKHQLSFETAATVLLDPLALTVPDREHVEAEERWITLGRASNGWLAVVVHTWTDTGPESARIRIISARRANRAEMKEYQGDD